MQLADEAAHVMRLQRGKVERRRRLGDQRLEQAQVAAIVADGMLRRAPLLREFVEVGGNERVAHART